MTSDATIGDEPRDGKKKHRDARRATGMNAQQPPQQPIPIPKPDGMLRRDQATTSMVPPPLHEAANPDIAPYYLHGKTRFLTVKVGPRQLQRAERQQRLLDGEVPSVVNETLRTWALPDTLLSPTRNHDSIVLEYGGTQSLVNVLGRFSRAVQWTDLLTGDATQSITSGTDPLGHDLSNLNHVYMVLVDSLDGRSKEIWLPCGFHGDTVNGETSSHYARIIDVEDMAVRLGPKLPISGGACAAHAVRVDGPDKPPHICSFGGTNGTHDAGAFLASASCYDRVRMRWTHPFGALPYGLDHANIVQVPSAMTCDGADRDDGAPSRLLIMNFRTESYGSQHSEILAHDIPHDGWTEEELQQSKATVKGAWYVYSPPLVFNDTTADLLAPRDAAGVVVANQGRYVLNFGGVHYTYPMGSKDKRKRITKAFSTIRRYDVCAREWTLVGDLGVNTFAIQTSASAELGIAVTCGGYLVELKHYNSNRRHCVVSRVPGLVLENHRLHGLAPFPDGFVVGSKAKRMDPPGESKLAVQLLS
jgi:hypothetical protein